MNKFNNTEQYIVNILGPALNGSPDDYKDAKFFKNKRYLKESQEWIEKLNITNKEDLLHYLNHHKYSIQKKFDTYRAKITMLTKEEKERFLSSMDSNYILNQYKIIERYGTRLPNSGISAYEYLLKINGYRHAYALDYISLEEFWKYSKPIALKCQEAYDSWNEYTFACVVGKMYAINIKYSMDMYNERYYIKRFIGRSYSSINETPWDMKL